MAAALLAVCALAGCQPSPSPDAGRIGVRAPPQAATRPVDAVLVLRDRLLARDGAGFARLAVPPVLHARLQAAWARGDSTWPVDELPLDARLPKLLAALQAPGAEAGLMATFGQQFAGADRDIDQAIRTLVLFGGEYVAKEADYTPEEREHVLQAMAALGDWALAAPLSEPARAGPFFAAVCAAARRSGIDGARGRAAWAPLGMAGGLQRLSPFIATLAEQLERQYGLDVDGALRGARVDLLQQAGDHARLRLRYALGSRAVDAVVPVQRVDGHWYLANYLRRAQAAVKKSPSVTET